MQLSESEFALKPSLGIFKIPLPKCISIVTEATLCICDTFRRDPTYHCTSAI